MVREPLEIDVSSVLQAAEELSSWGLELDTETIHMQGRRLNPQKILFNRKTVTASDEAEWSRDAVKECCISSVRYFNLKMLLVIDCVYSVYVCTCSLVCLLVDTQLYVVLTSVM